MKKYQGIINQIRETELYSEEFVISLDADQESIYERILKDFVKFPRTDFLNKNTRLRYSISNSPTDQSEVKELAGDLYVSFSYTFGNYSDCLSATILINDFFFDKLLKENLGKFLTLEIYTEPPMAVNPSKYP